MTALAARTLSRQLSAAFVKTLPPADAELVALAQRFSELHARVEETNQQCFEALKRFEELRPEFPRTMLWRAGDPCGYSRGSTFRENGKQYLWCSLDDIEKWRKQGLPNFEDPRAAKRAAELVDALAQFVAAEEAADVAAGMTAAEKENDAALAAQMPIVERIIELRPTTVEGLRAMASVLVADCWSGKIRASEYTEQSLVGIIVSVLTGLPIEQPDQVQ